MNDARIEVKGVKELQKALREIDKGLPKELAAGLAEASEIVLRAAQPLVPVRTGKAAASMKVRKQQRGASIAVGGNKAEYYPWLDFGGSVGRKKSVKRPFIKEGRYIYPTLRVKGDEVKAKVDEVIERLGRQAGFDQEGRSDK